MADWVPTETRIKSILSRQMRLYQLTLRPESTTKAFEHIQDRLFHLYERGEVGPENVMAKIEERVNHIVDTTLELTKDQKNVGIIEPQMISQVLAILVSSDQSHLGDHHNSNNNINGDDDSSRSGETKSVVFSIDVKKAIKDATLQQSQPVFIMDPFNMPKFNFSDHQNQYIPAALSQFQNPGSTPQLPLTRLSNNTQLHSDPISQTKMFTDRYFSIFQRCQRQERFAQQQRQLLGKTKPVTKPSNSILHTTDNTRLYEVDSLRGNVGELTVFGYISDIIGDIFLESPTARIRLDLSNCTLLDSDIIQKGLDGDKEQQQQTTYTTYTHNSQLSQALQRHNDPTQSSPAQLSKFGTPRSHQTTTTPSKFMKSNGIIDPTDQTVVDHSSLFAKLFAIGTFVLVTGRTVGTTFVAKRAQLPKHEPRRATLELYPALQVIHPYTDYISNPIQHYIYTNGKQRQVQINHLANHQPVMTSIAKSGATSDVNSLITNQKQLLEALEDHSPTQSSSLPNSVIGDHALDRIIVLGEIYLHDQSTITYLHRVLADLDTLTPPKFIVFTGNYMSPQFYIQNRFNPYAFKVLFDKLADVIYGYKNLRTLTHFIFAAGTYDYLYGNTTPTPPPPPAMVSRLAKVLNNVTFTSNLVNIRYFGRDLKICRQDFYQSIINRDTNHFPTSKVVDDFALPEDIRLERERNEAKKRRLALKSQQEEDRAAGRNKKKKTAKSQFDMDDDNNDDGDDGALGFNLDDALDEFNQINSRSSSGGMGNENDGGDEFSGLTQEEIELDNQTRFIGDMVIKYITSQDSLLIDHPSVKPTLWDYSHAFSLTSLPDAVILVDIQNPYNINKYQTVFYNTGPFTGKWSYVQYFPYNNTVHPIILGDGNGMGQ